MNAPANIKRPVQAEDIWSPEERAHRAAISIHCPNDGELKMGYRARIAALRDQASAALRVCSDDAAGVLTEVARIATLSVYAPMDSKQLVLRAAALTLAMDAARAMERASRNGQ